MNFTLKMCNGELFTLEKAVGCSTTANGLIVFFSDFGEKIRCTKISDGMKDLIYYRKDVSFILENIDAIYTCNMFNTDDTHKRTQKKEPTCPLLEHIDELRRLLNA